MRRVVPAVVAALLLLLGAASAMVAWSAETCTGNVPDSLFAGVVTLPLTVAGFALLAWKPTLRGTLAAAIIPAPFALSYTAGALRLLGGTPACTLVTGYEGWEPSGDEPFLAALWLACALAFWLGLALALHRGYRARRNDRYEHSID